MAQGLQIFDAAGNLTIDVGSSLGRLLGSLDTGGNSGTHDEAAFNDGIPFFHVIPQAEGRPPTVYVSGITLVWTYSDTPSYYPNVPVTIVFGIR